MRLGLLPVVVLGIAVTLPLLASAAGLQEKESREWTPITDLRATTQKSSVDGTSIFTLHIIDPENGPGPRAIVAVVSTLSLKNKAHLAYSYRLDTELGEDAVVLITERGVFSATPKDGPWSSVRDQDDVYIKLPE